MLIPMRCSRWFVISVALPICLFALVILLLSTMSNERSIFVNSGETYIWSLSNSVLRGDLTILSSSKDLSLYYYLKSPNLKLSDPAVLNGKYWLDPGDHVTYSRYLEVGSVVTLNFVSVEGVNFFLFEGHESFSQFEKGNQADYLAMKLSMNSVREGLTFTIKSANTYFMVFDNVFDEFYSHLDVKLSLKLMEYSNDVNNPYEEILPTDCPKCLTDAVPTNTEKLFILPLTFSALGYLALRSTSEGRLINTTTTRKNDLIWSPTTHKNAHIAPGVTVTLKGTHSGEKTLWIVTVTAICCIYFLILLSCQRAQAKLENTGVSTSVNLNGSDTGMDRCIRMTYLLEESARRRSLMIGSQSQPQSYEAVRDAEEEETKEAVIRYAIDEVSTKTTRGDGSRVSTSTVGLVTPMKGTCSSRTASLCLAGTRHNLYGTAADEPTEMLDYEALSESKKSTTSSKKRPPVDNSNNFMMTPDSIPEEKNTPRKKSIYDTKHFRNVKSTSDDTDGPQSQGHSVAYLKEFYNYFASKNLKKGIQSHKKTPTKSGKKVKNVDECVDWRGRNVDEAGSESDDIIDVYSISEHERRRMSAYKEDSSRRGRAVPRRSGSFTLSGMGIGSEGSSDSKAEGYPSSPATSIGRLVPASSDPSPVAGIARLTAAATASPGVSRDGSRHSIPEIGSESSSSYTAHNTEGGNDYNEPDMSGTDSVEGMNFSIRKIVRHLNKSESGNGLSDSIEKSGSDDKFVAIRLFQTDPT